MNALIYVVSSAFAWQEQTLRATRANRVFCADEKTYPRRKHGYY